MCADIRILRSFVVSFSFTLRLRLCSDQQWHCVEKVTPPIHFNEATVLAQQGPQHRKQPAEKFNLAQFWLQCNPRHPRIGCEFSTYKQLILVDCCCNTNSAIPQFNLQSPQQGIKWLWYQDITFKGYWIFAHSIINGCAVCILMSNKPTYSWIHSSNWPSLTPFHHLAGNFTNTSTTLC